MEFDDHLLTVPGVFHGRVVATLTDIAGADLVATGQVTSRIFHR